MSPNEGTHTFSKARVMPKVFTDLRASETMNAESDFLSFSSITASPVHSLSESQGDAEGVHRSEG